MSKDKDSKPTGVGVTTQHTPGPWHVTPAGYISSHGHGYIPLITPFREEAHRDKYRGPTPEALANALLIAAAPKLLEKLKKLVGRSDNGDVIEPGWYEIEEARVAITEAEKGK